MGKWCQFISMLKSGIILLVFILFICWWYFIFVRKNRGMGRKKILNRGELTVTTTLRVKKYTYERLLRLKVIEGSGSTVNRFINGILLKYVMERKGLLEGRELDYSEFE